MEPWFLLFTKKSWRRLSLVYTLKLEGLRLWSRTMIWTASRSTSEENKQANQFIRIKILGWPKGLNQMLYHDLNHNIHSWTILQRRVDPNPSMVTWTTFYIYSSYVCTIFKKNCLMTWNMQVWKMRKEILFSQQSSCQHVTGQHLYAALMHNNKDWKTAEGLGKQFSELFFLQFLIYMFMFHICF